MARPRFQFNLRYILLTLVPGIAVIAWSLSTARFSERVWIALGTCWWLVGIAVWIRIYRAG